MLPSLAYLSMAKATPEHARCSASSSAMWLYCAASIEAGARYPDTSSPFAEEGTAAHALAQYCSENECDASNAPVSDEWAKWDSAEFRSYIQEHLDFIRSFTGCDYWAYELRVNYAPWVRGGFGTADTVLTRGSELIVVDLKFGKGIKVEAEQNTQLMLYAIGAIEHFDFDKEFETARLCISQPRLNHFDQWALPIGDVWAEVRRG